MQDLNFEPVKISLRDVFFIIFSKLYVLIGTFFIVVGITFIYCIKAVPVYEAGGTVLLKPFFDSRQQLDSGNRFDVYPVTQQDINTEVKIMYSRKLMHRLVQELDMDEADEISRFKQLLIDMGISFKPDPLESAIDYLQENIEIIPITMSNIILVLFKGKDPEWITKVVNTYLTYYIDHHIEVYRTGAGVDFYSRQAAQALEKLLKSERELKNFQAKWTVIDIEKQNEYNLKLLQILRENLSIIYSKTAEKKGKIFQLNKDFKKSGQITAMTEEFRENELLTQLSKNLIPLLVEKERIGLLYPESSIEYLHNLYQVERFKKEIRKEQDQLLKGLEYDLYALDSQKKTFESEIKRIEAGSLFLTGKEIEMRKLIRDVEINKKNYELYQAKTEEARISEQRDASRVANVSINGWAQKPSIPVFPRKKKMLLMSILVGFVAGTGCSFAAYYLDHTVKTPEDLARNSNIQVLASLEKVKI
ncbi:Putative tyrosine kinase domain-containing protein [Desulfonema limicola]|uniref:Tyrosine kinase domain-containing protein n=1 Tax=Desulfonema limicola TaxID=45656 RepID=A0A975GK06_9BACT|nr:GNVR domain-containing protein [Desulfonema limicola]QTA83338.1 Putative tyrosine kinase domain-containing protein [Desulfonema limicola]